MGCHELATNCAKEKRGRGKKRKTAKQYVRRGKKSEPTVALRMGNPVQKGQNGGLKVHKIKK